MPPNNDIFSTPAERVKLLRRGNSGKDIEELYIEINSILILGTNWQDSHETGPFFEIHHPPPISRHVSSHVGERCAVDLREMRA